MALSNIVGWNEDKQASAACGTVCGANDKPEEKHQHAEVHVELLTSKRKIGKAHEVR